MFGGEDVDLRQTSGPSTSGGTSWSQVKVKTRGPSTEIADEDIRDILRNEKQNRPPAPVSPASSVGSVRGICDPLGRPLLYNRLPGGFSGNSIGLSEIFELGF